MSPYLSFLAFVAVVVVIPGPDVFITLRGTVAGGRQRGLWTAAGVCVASVAQGLLAAAGLGAVIVHAEPVFRAIKWAGVAYLVYLGVTALLSAWRGSRTSDAVDGASKVSARTGFRQGFLCNITNPKVLAFNLAVLPQFVGADAGLVTMTAYAVSLAGLGGVFLTVLVLAASHARDWLARPRVRRGMEAVTGVALLGFGARLAADA